MTLDLAAAATTAEDVTFQKRVQMAIVAVAVAARQSPVTVPGDRAVKEMALRILKDPSTFTEAASWALASLGLTTQSPDTAIQTAVSQMLTQIS